ncbi:hypothetical protein BGZ51_001421 [Haplosporangium sp. Z 767]|nr:hypothetical protein BGZ51_001421 [Haplosporangium sp. Z 767]
MPMRKTYLIVAMIFFMVVFLSHRKAPFYTGSESEDNSQRHPLKQGANGGGYKPPYGSDRSQEKPDPPYKQPIIPPVEKTPTTTTTTPPLPNTSGHYDAMIVIPSSWKQMQNRKWVRDTMFGIKNNLEPCKKHDSHIIYKFYIHGRSTWQKSTIHSAQFMQAQVRDLHAEFMEYDDWHFTNTTATDRHTIWGDALDWAVNTYVPKEKIKVESVMIFDATTIANVPKILKSAKENTSPNGFVATWGDSATPFAAVVSFPVLEQILKNRKAIKENHNLVDLVTAATAYYSNPTPTFKVVKGQGQLWESDIGLIQDSTLAVGQIYQQEDWHPIVSKLAIEPTPACTFDANRQKNIAVLTSSYIYADMCMAEASLPAADNKREYAAKHGYDFVARSAEFAQEEFRHRRLVWGKIGAIQKTLPHYEWLLWMDMDAIVANLDQDVRDIIRLAEDNKEQEGNEISLIVSRPQKDKMLNAGVMLIKNTEWSRKFWSEVQRRTEWYNLRPSYEQGAIWDVMRDPAWASGVHLFDRNDHIMNTFPQYYKDGDFVIHFAPAGCPSVQVLEALEKIGNGESAVGVGVEKRILTSKGKNAV